MNSFKVDQDHLNQVTAELQQALTSAEEAYRKTGSYKRSTKEYKAITKARLALENACRDEVLSQFSQANPLDFDTIAVRSTTDWKTHLTTNHLDCTKVWDGEVIHITATPHLRYESTHSGRWEMHIQYINPGSRKSRRDGFYPDDLDSAIEMVLLASAGSKAERQRQQNCNNTSTKAAAYFPNHIIKSYCNDTNPPTKWETEVDNQKNNYDDNAQLRASADMHHDGNQLSVEATIRFRSLSAEEAVVFMNKIEDLFKQFAPQVPLAKTCRN